jgi:hypothetical protein
MLFDEKLFEIRKKPHITNGPCYLQSFSHFPVIFLQIERKKSSTEQGGDSQNIIGKFKRFFVILDSKILRLFRLKVFFEADILKV